VIVAAYAAGLIANRLVWRRLATLARRTDRRWDDAIVAEIEKRVPLWSLLLGTYLAAGFWTLSPNVRTALSGALFVLTIGSVTFLCASLLAGFARQYGQTVQDALPVTTLTENVVRIAVMSIGVLIILNGLGLSITPILTALGVGGLACAVPH